MEQEYGQNEDSLTPSFADYVFFPISQLLKQNKLPSDRAIELVLNIIGFLIRCCWNNDGMSSNMAKQLVILITFLTGGSPPGSSNTNKSNINSNTKEYDDRTKSDELKNEGSKALYSLFQSMSSSSNPHLFDFFKNVENLPPLAHVISVLLNVLVTSSDSIEAQLSSLDALHILVSILINDGELLSNVLPGFMSSLCKTISPRSGIKRHHKILEKSLLLMGSLLQKVFDDYDLGIKNDEILESTTVNDILKQQVGTINNDNDNDKKIHRTNSWLKATKEQVKMSLSSIIPIRTHSNSEVRMSLLSLYEKLITHCNVSLDNCLPIAIDTMAFLLSYNSKTDLDYELHDRIKIDIELYSHSKKNFKNILKDKLFNWINSLSNLMLSNDEDYTITTINLIKITIGIISEIDDDDESLNFLTNSLINILETSINLRATINKQKMIQTNNDESLNYVISTLSPSSVTTISKSNSNLNSNDDIVNNYDFKQFGIENGPSEKVTNSLYLLLRQISKYKSGNLTLRVLSQRDYTLESTLSSTNNLISFWMYSQLMKGYMNNVNDNDKEGLESFINISDDDDNNNSTKIDPSIIYDFLTTCGIIISAPLKFIETKAGETFNAYSAIAIDGIGSVINFMGPAFKSELIDHLFPIVNSLASTNQLVRSSAQNTISKIIKECNYESLTDLLVSNADYLIDAISIRFSTLEISPQSTGVLMVLIKLAGASLSPYIDDVIDTMFVILDDYHGYNKLVDNFFIIFKELIEQIQIQYKQEIDNYNETKKKEEDKRQKLLSSVHITTQNQLIEMLNTKPKIDLEEPIKTDGKIWNHHNKPFARGNDEIKEGNIREVDSDDEDEDSELFEEPMDESLISPQENESDDYDPKCPIPDLQYNLVLKIAKYAQNFLTHESIFIKNNIIKLISLAAPILSTNPDKFLPHVNEIWPTLITNFNENKNEIFVLESLFECVASLTKYAGDFMVNRIEGLIDEHVKKQLLLLNSSKENIGKDIITRKSSVSIINNGIPEYTFNNMDNLNDIITLSATSLKKDSNYNHHTNNSQQKITKTYNSDSDSITNPTENQKWISKFTYNSRLLTAICKSLSIILKSNCGLNLSKSKITELITLLIPLLTLDRQVPPLITIKPSIKNELLESFDNIAGDTLWLEMEKAKFKYEHAYGNDNINEKQNNSSFQKIPRSDKFIIISF